MRLGAIYIAVKLLPTESHHRHNSIDFTMPVPSIPRHPAPLPPLDVLFFSALAIALGWATLEIVWTARTFLQQVALYDDVLEHELGSGDEEEDLMMQEEQQQHETAALSSAYGATAHSTVPLSRQPPLHPQHHPHYNTQLYPVDKDQPESHDRQDGLQYLSESEFERVMDPVERAEMEEDFEQHVREIERRNLETQLGVPLYEIPVAVLVVWRLDSCVSLAHHRSTRHDELIAYDTACYFPSCSRSYSRCRFGRHRPLSLPSHSGPRSQRPCSRMPYYHWSGYPAFVGSASQPCRT